MNGLNDKDLREALRRHEAKRPKPLVSEYFCDKVMQTLMEPESPRQAKRRHVWLYPIIGAAATIALLFSLSIAFNSQDGEEPSLVAQTDTVKVKERPIKKEESKEMDDTVKKGKEILRMFQTPKHYMAKIQTPPPHTPPRPYGHPSPQRGGESRGVAARSDSRQGEPTSVEAVADLRQGEPTSVEAVADLRQGEPTSVEALQDEYAQQTNRVQQVEPLPEVLTERDIPITRPENYKYTPEEIALMKKQAREAYLKWVELELEIAKYNLEQTANNYSDL